MTFDPRNRSSRPHFDHISMQICVHLCKYRSIVQSIHCLSIYASVCLLTPQTPPNFHSPGPGFAIFSVIQLLLPVMALWLQRSHGEHSYWDVAAANFKHAIGLSCELVVEHVNSFIHSGEMLVVYLCQENIQSNGRDLPETLCCDA